MTFAYWTCGNGYLLSATPVGNPQVLLTENAREARERPHGYFLYAIPVGPESFFTGTFRVLLDFAHIYQ